MCAEKAFPKKKIKMIWWEIIFFHNYKTWTLTTNPKTRSRRASVPHRWSKTLELIVSTPTLDKPSPPRQRRPSHDFYNHPTNLLWKQYVHEALAQLFTIFHHRNCIILMAVIVMSQKFGFLFLELFCNFLVVLLQRQRRVIDGGPASGGHKGDGGGLRSRGLRRGGSGRCVFTGAECSAVRKHVIVSGSPGVASRIAGPVARGLVGLTLFEVSRWKPCSIIREEAVTSVVHKQRSAVVSAFASVLHFVEFISEFKSTSFILRRASGLIIIYQVVILIAECGRQALCNSGGIKENISDVFACLIVCGSVANTAQRCASICTTVGIPRLCCITFIQSNLFAKPKFKK